MDTNNSTSDLDYAHDICLLSQKLQHMQAKINNLAQIAKKTGLRVSKQKTKLMRTNNSQQRDKMKLTNCTILTVSPPIYAIGEKKPAKNSGLQRD